MVKSGRKWEMFLGHYYHTIDEKNRVVIPSSFRGEISGKVYLTQGMEKCIFLYPEEVWNRFYQKITTLSLTRKETREFSRFFLANATCLDIDGQGRIVLPDYLKNYAEINRQVVWVGVGERLEIWAEEIWRPYHEEMGKKFGELTEQIVDTGI
ncbi:MAG: division/cell wall cluster transcriptional repressor MraZ [Atribacterota bacterium]|jgi:MraZ protein|nr:division/cell wall cluster transcriptional repressor MraZ [Atribacterota bacterium]